MKLPNQNLMDDDNSYDPVFLPNSSSSKASVDSILDELLKHTKTCTHTHTCNPPGPDASHTHTCFHTHTHTHTQVFSSGEDTKTHSKTTCLKPRRPSGNREAVRKYREKKKAQIAYLEEEVKKLRVLNQNLVRKLQRQAVLEAEVLRLRTLLFDFIGKIDIELGSISIPMNCSSNGTISFKEGDCGIQSTSTKAMGLHCQAEIPCFHPQGKQSIPIGYDPGSNPTRPGPAQAVDQL